MEEEFHEPNLQILKYDIQMEFDENWNNTSHVIIYFKSLESLDSFSLHSHLNCHVENPVCKQEGIENETHYEYKDDSFITFCFSEKLQKGLGQLSFTVKNKPKWGNKEKRGPFVETDGIRYTDFEPFLARKAFPCIDNTSSKSEFQLTVKSPIQKVNISNTPIQSIKINEKIQTIVFETTPKISPYNFAFICGNFKEITSTKHNDFKISVWGVNNYIKTSNIIIDSALQTIKYMEELTQVTINKTGLKKLDFCLVPKFPDQGMESPGCIYLLSDRDKDFYTDLVIHETIHQWIGNYLSFPFWIKEGLTTIFEDIIYDIVVKEKNSPREVEQFIDIQKMEKTFEEGDYDEFADAIYQYKKEDELKILIQKLTKGHPFGYVSEKEFIEMLKEK